jgi:hypothetical protein
LQYLITVAWVEGVCKLEGERVLGVREKDM